LFVKVWLVERSLGKLWAAYFPKGRNRSLTGTILRVNDGLLSQILHLCFDYKTRGRRGLLCNISGVIIVLEAANTIVFNKADLFEDALASYNWATFVIQVAPDYLALSVQQLTEAEEEDSQREGR